MGIVADSSNIAIIEEVVNGQILIVTKWRTANYRVAQSAGHYRVTISMDSNTHLFGHYDRGNHVVITGSSSRLI